MEESQFSVRNKKNERNIQGKGCARDHSGRVWESGEGHEIEPDEGVGREVRGKDSCSENMNLQ